MVPDYQCLVGPIAVLFVDFFCPGFRSPLRPFLCFKTVFSLYVFLCDVSQTRYADQVYICILEQHQKPQGCDFAREKNRLNPLPPSPPPPHTHTHTDHHHHHHHALHPHSPTPLHLYLRWMDILGWFSAISHHGDNVCDFPTPQRAHDVHTTSAQRRCNVMTLHRRWSDVVLTSCACWAASQKRSTVKEKYLLPTIKGNHCSQVEQMLPL